MRIREFSIIILLLFIFASTMYAKKGFEYLDNLGRPLFEKGVIAIKIKDSMAKVAPQDGAVSFNQHSLDALSKEYYVYKLEKMFRVNEKKFKSNKKLPDLSRIYIISFPEDMDVKKVAGAFSKDSNIEIAEPIPANYYDESSQSVDEIINNIKNTIPNDPRYGDQQHLPQIKAPEAWDIHKGENGAEVIVGIVDSGVDWDHPDLIDNLWQNLAEDADGDGKTIEFDGTKWILDPGDLNGTDDDGNGFIDDLIGWNFMTDALGNEDNNPDDPRGHGTHVAGLAAAVTDNGVGVASISWNVKIMVTGHGWVGGGTSVGRGYEGIVYAAENGADIINTSWGGGAYSAMGELVIQYANHLGSIVLSSAGNSNTDIDQYPSSYPGCISVASVGGNDKKADYSEYGFSIDISAPGGTAGANLLSTGMAGGYELKMGTSMACPVTTGLFALVKSYHPDWTNGQIINQILGTADYIDDINPNHIYQMGAGRINAYRALTETNVIGPSDLKLRAEMLDPTDDSGNKVLEAGEEGYVNVRIRNYVHTAYTPITVTLSTNDPDIQILNGTALDTVKGDGYTIISDKFRVKLKETIKAKIAQFKVNVEADNDMTIGREMEVELLVAPGGILVWEGIPGGQDYSGEFIRDFLLSQGYPTLYTTSFPPALTGFEAVFLSFGNVDNDYTAFNDDMAAIVKQYLKEGGNVYLEGGDALGFNQAENPELLTLFGIDSVSDGVEGNVPVNILKGQTGAITDGIQFNGSNQVGLTWIDIYYPNSMAKSSFVNEGYGTVALEGEGTFGQKTFVFSYALEPLTDGNQPNKKSTLLRKILAFFDFSVSAGGADFIADNRTGNAPIEINFKDESFMPSGNAITSWKWDFNNDGTFDSQIQNPSYIFENPGVYDVKLEISDGTETNSVIKEDFIKIYGGETSLEFNGHTGYAKLPEVAEVILNSPFTIEGYIYPTGWGNGAEGRIFDKGNIAFYVNGADSNLVFSVQYFDYTETKWQTPKNSISLDKWQAVSVSFDSLDGASFYIDGVKQETNLVGEPVTKQINASIKSIIGARTDYKKTFSGRIDELRIWNKKRSEEEYISDFDRKLTGKERELISYFAFNEGAGKVFSDGGKYELNGEMNVKWSAGIELKDANPIELATVSNDIMYASTGSLNEEQGFLLSIDLTKGTGTKIGGVGFSPVSNLAIDLEYGTLVALNRFQGAVNLLLIDASDAHAFIEEKIELDVVAFALDYSDSSGYLITSDKKLYHMIGEETTLVGALKLKIRSVTYNPFTKEIWGSVAEFVKKDRIVKINKTTGEITEVGRTGLNQTVQSLAFNSEGKLFGTIGSESQQSKLIRIDTNTGEGTEVGDIGFEGVMGLAYAFDPATSVDYEENNHIPTVFDLTQNYPNPFNPSTNIQFSLPVDAEVKIVVFNLLGQKIAELTNKVYEAGNHSLLWNVASCNKNISSGVYFYNIDAKGVNGKSFNKTMKMLFIK